MALLGLLCSTLLLTKWLLYGKHKQKNPRVLVAILIVNADNVIMQHGDSDNGDLVMHLLYWAPGLVLINEIR